MVSFHSRHTSLNTLHMAILSALSYTVLSPNPGSSYKNFLCLIFSLSCLKRSIYSTRHFLFLNPFWSPVKYPLIISLPFWQHLLIHSARYTQQTYLTVILKFISVTVPFIDPHSYSLSANLMGLFVVSFSIILSPYSKITLVILWTGVLSRF